jgi:hypothetical protein
LGFTQPGKLDAIINSGTIELGMVPRMLLFQGRQGAVLRPERGHNLRTDEIPRDIKAIAEKWQEFTPEKEPGKDDRLTFSVWEFNADACSIIGQATAEYEQKLAAANLKNSPAAAIFTRAAQFIKRLSLVFAADRLDAPQGNHIVTGDDTKKAKEIVGISVENLVKHINEVMAESPHGMVTKKVFSFLKSSRLTGSEEWFTATEIRNNVRHRLIDISTELEKILKSLSSDGCIDIRKSNVNGRERLQYRWSGNG